uniref:Uncharacterized protein n=1 Tax=Anguilla anguilla TaxID=7936 RepID=A0A0E9X444_ANGAN
MAGLWSVGTCCFVLFFHTEYRRLRAEADAIISTETEPGRSQSTREA